MSNRCASCSLVFGEADPYWYQSGTLVCSACHARGTEADKTETKTTTCVGCYKEIAGAPYFDGDDAFCSDCARVEFSSVTHRMKTDLINNPPHYDIPGLGIQVYDVIRALDLDYDRGNTIKYVARAGRKSDLTEIQDLRKARWYLDRAIEAAEKAREYMS